MNSPFQVIHYNDENGSDPIESFLNGLRPTNQWSIITSTILRLESVGLQLCETKAAKVFNIRLQLYELTKGDYRVVFFADGNTFVLLHGFPKHSQKTFREDKKIVETRLEKYKSEKSK